MAFFFCIFDNRFIYTGIADYCFDHPTSLTTSSATSLSPATSTTSIASPTPTSTSHKRKDINSHIDLTKKPCLENVKGLDDEKCADDNKMVDDKTMLKSQDELQEDLSIQVPVEPPSIYSLISAAHL